MDELMLSAIQGTIFIMSFVYSKQTLYHKAFEEAVLDWGWTWDLPYSKQTLYHEAIKEVTLPNDKQDKCRFWEISCPGYIWAYR